MFALLRTGFVIAVTGLTVALPTSADAQWYDGWGWGWMGGWREPAWTTYYPGSYSGGYVASYGGGYYAPGGCCDPCGCNPCGCNPCGGCAPCGSACGPGGCPGGNCPGGNCAYDAPANGAPIPDPNNDVPPLRRTNPPSRPRDDNQTFETPTRGSESMDDVERFPPRSPRSSSPARPRPTDSTDPGTESTDPFQDRSTNPASGARRSGTGSDGGLVDPPLDGGFGTQKIEVPAAEGTVIPQRKPAETQDIKDGSDTNGPRLDLKATSTPIVPKTRLAGHLRTPTALRTVKTPVVNDWSAAMTEPRVLR